VPLRPLVADDAESVATGTEGDVSVATDAYEGSGRPVVAVGGSGVPDATDLASYDQLRELLRGGAADAAAATAKYATMLITPHPGAPSTGSSASPGVRSGPVPLPPSAGREVVNEAFDYEESVTGRGAARVAGGDGASIATDASHMSLPNDGIAGGGGGEVDADSPPLHASPLVAEPRSLEGRVPHAFYDYAEPAGGVQPPAAAAALSALAPASGVSPARFVAGVHAAAAPPPPPPAAAAARPATAASAPVAAVDRPAGGVSLASPAVTHASGAGAHRYGMWASDDEGGGGGGGSISGWTHSDSDDSDDDEAAYFSAAQFPAAGRKASLGSELGGGGSDFGGGFSGDGRNWASGSGGGGGGGGASGSARGGDAGGGEGGSRYGGGGNGGADPRRRAALASKRRARVVRDLRKRRALALAVALRAAGTWGDVSSRDAVSSGGAGLAHEELLALVWEIGAVLTGLPVAALPAVSAPGMPLPDEAELEEDQPSAGASRWPLPSSRRTRKRLVRLYALAAWQATVPAFQAGLLSYANADGSAPAVQKGVLRDVRVALSDWWALVAVSLPHHIPAPSAVMAASAAAAAAADAAGADAALLPAGGADDFSFHTSPAAVGGGGGRFTAAHGGGADAGFDDGEDGEPPTGSPAYDAFIAARRAALDPARVLAMVTGATARPGGGGGAAAYAETGLDVSVDTIGQLARDDLAHGGGGDEYDGEVVLHPPPVPDGAAADGEELDQTAMLNAHMLAEAARHLTFPVGSPLAAAFAAAAAARGPGHRAAAGGAGGRVVDDDDDDADGGAEW